MAHLSRPQPGSTGLFIVLFVFSILAKLVGTIWLKNARSASPELKADGYSFLGHDYPDEWTVERPPVLLAGSHTHRFHLNTPDGAAEWSAMVPGDGLVYLGEHKRPFTVSMFHQMRCLDIIREELVRERGGDSDLPSPLTRHCLNYMRQMVLCRGDMHLESFQYPNNKDPIDKEGLYECRDWEAVYNAARKNQAEYVEGRGGESSSPLS